MLFKDYHIPMIRSGSKTVTRRDWKDTYNGPNPGTVVAAKTELLKPDVECDCFIRILHSNEEPLGEVTDADAQKEGDYETVEEFIDGYEAVYGDGSWNPDKVVNVIEFEYVGRTRPDDETEQTTPVTDGGVEHRLGPHRVPRIDCGRCGHEHHIDAATGEYQGRCSKCYAFLRRPTDAEQKKFYEFMDWKARHVEERREHQVRGAM